MRATRSATCCTSGKTWEERKIVAPADFGFRDERVERLLDQGVETDGRLVEDDQVGPVHEGLDESDLLAVALRERLDRSVDVEFEARRERACITEAFHSA